jgi:hypothetical protein
MDDFLSGAIVFGYAIAGLFFLRFWKRTADRLFVMFAIAFWLLGAIRLAITVVPLVTGATVNEDHYLYWIRLVAYLLILAAIVDKNWRK